jgi:hypothetical protein
MICRKNIDETFRTGIKISQYNGKRPHSMLFFQDVGHINEGIDVLHTYDFDIIRGDNLSDKKAVIRNNCENLFFLAFFVLHNFIFYLIKESFVVRLYLIYIIV